MTEFWTEMAARAKVPTWPANNCVTAPSEYWQIEVNMAGPARYHSFFVSTENCRKKSHGSVTGPRSSAPGAKKAPVEEWLGPIGPLWRRRRRSSSWPGGSTSLRERRGCLPFSILGKGGVDGYGGIDEEILYNLNAYIKEKWPPDLIVRKI